MRYYLIVLFFSIPTFGYSANRYSRPDGTWSNTNGGANCGCTPASGDDIFVNHAINLAGAFSLSSGGSITINSGGYLTITGGLVNGSLDIQANSNLIINSGGTLETTGDLNFRNNSDVLINSGGVLLVGRNFKNFNNSNDIVFNGSVTIAGNFENGNGGEIDFGPGATISIGGSCTNTGTVNNPSGSSTTGTCAGSVLPVKLIELLLLAKFNQIDLNWSTSKEIDFEYFVIQHSNDGFEFFEIGQIPGAGYNTETRQDYSYTHTTPTIGFNYYRLKAVDLDGTFEYFGPVVEKFNGSKALWVHPNPASGSQVSYKINFTANETDRVQVIDQLGVIVADISAKESNGIISFGGILKPGSYVLRYSSPVGVQFARFVVME